MTADALKKITTDALDKLAGLLDEGHSDQLTALLKTMARFPKYSWHNVALIATQCPTATRVAGFHTWRTNADWAAPDRPPRNGALWGANVRLSAVTPNSRPGSAWWRRRELHPRPKQSPPGCLRACPGIWFSLGGSS